VISRRRLRLPHLSQLTHSRQSSTVPIRHRQKVHPLVIPIGFRRSRSRDFGFASRHHRGAGKRTSRRRTSTARETRPVPWIGLLGRAIDSESRMRLQATPTRRSTDGRMSAATRRPCSSEARCVSSRSRKTIFDHAVSGPLVGEGDLSPDRTTRTSSCGGPRGSELDAT